tara:strand:- start:908 stop:1276 length:369 start_codon:yes stop_codon:yes gene_type:complete
MAKLHHTEYKKNYKEYILGNIHEDIEGNSISSEADKINYIFDRFNSEYGWRVNQVGKVAAMVDWLQGLALNIEFYNDEIINLAIRLGSIDENPSEKLQDRVIENYWDFMANIILGFETRKEV